MSTDRRDILIGSGMELFRRYGYREVSVEDLTRSCGLSVGTFYNYFKSKEEFYGKILDIIETEGIKKADAVVSRLRSPMNKLRAVYRFTVLGLKQNEILRGILRNEERYIFPGLAERNRRQQTLRSHIEGMLADIIREGTAKGVFRGSLYQNPAALVITVFDSLIRHMDDPGYDRLVGDLLVFLQRGLRRTLRLRRRDERLDRRRLPRSFQEEWLDRGTSGP